MVYSRLSRRIRKLGLASFEDYLRLLDINNEETEFFVNALTTNLTSFFREPHHFEILKDYLSKHTGPLVIWCAGCSSGEEAYSVAISCAEARGSFDHNVKIYASDIDSGVLSIAQKGIYQQKAISDLSLDYKKAFFLKGKGNKADSVKLNPKIVGSVHFFKQNLFDSDWKITDKVDVIFCRNVMIYFDKPTQDALVERFTKILKPNGLYMAGHSENFARLSQYLKPLGQTAYTKQQAYPDA